MKYDRTIADGDCHMSIDDNNVATVTMPDSDIVVQQLQADEVNKVIAEFEDSSGDMMCNPDSVFQKYPALKALAP